MHKNQEDFKTAIKRVFEHFGKQNLGLLGYIQPLIASLARKDITLNPGLSFQEVSQAYLETFINLAPVCMGCLDKKLTIQQLSPQALGWIRKHHKSYRTSDIKSLVGKPLQPFFDNAKELNKGLRIALTGKAWRDSLLRHEIQPGHNRWARWEAFPWLDADGHHVSQIVVFWEDITDRQDVLMANKKLQQSNELLENYSAVFSHDMIQPLRQIANFYQLIKADYAKHCSANEFMGAVFQGLEKSLNHIQGLCEGIILYSKKGELTVSPQKVSLFQLLDDITKSSLSQLRESLKINIPQDVYLYANPTCMTQLFQNLLANAIKYSTPTNLTITLSGTQVSPHTFQFYLHNRGCCVGPVRHKNAFNPFQSSFQDGAGLGLMICKKIVQAYGGKIALRSSKSKGTVVSFTLPFVPNLEAEPPTKTPDSHQACLG